MQLIKSYSYGIVVLFRNSELTMPVKRKMPGGGTLSSWAPGESGNPKGRPRKIALSLKNEGYKKAQVQQTIDKMAALTKSELEEISKNKNATVLELGIAKMISDYIKKGENGIFRIYCF